MREINTISRHIVVVVFLLQVMCPLALSQTSSINPVDYLLSGSCFYGGTTYQQVKKYRFESYFWQSLAADSTAYFDIEGTQLRIRRSAIHGLGLFAKAAYAANDTIVLVFKKIGTGTNFYNDYMETVCGSFINDGLTVANCIAVLAPDGVYLQAKQAIATREELTCDYRQLIALFPSDNSVEPTMKYW